MITSCNLATFPDRLPILPAMIASVYDQFDVVRVYLNNWKGPVPSCLKRNKIEFFHCGPDLTDNGKFYFVPEPGEPDEYYFTVDDDLVYPKDYVSVTLKNMDKYPGQIISYHGRKLLGVGRRYYRDHKAYRCLGSLSEDVSVDVPGTGVAAWNTKYFKPSTLWNSPYKKMSDLVLAKEAAQEGVGIVCCAHRMDWFGYLNPTNTIWDQHNGKPTPAQNRLADEIFTIKNSK